MGPRRRGHRLSRSTTGDRWSAAGLGELTGRPDGPPLAPAEDVVARMEALGAPIGVDALALLAERAPLLGLTRAGPISCGGATQLLRAADGWIALSLSRESDVELLPALLGIGIDDDVAAAVATLPTDQLRAGAILLGLPLAELGEVRPPPAPVVATRHSTGAPLGRRPVVVDFSSLWAGPLCSRLLLERGAQVRKVESVTRPDGARATPQFFELMNDGKEQIAVDVREFGSLIEEADVVIEGSRPRAFEQLGIDAAAFGGVWLSITGYGRAPGERDRVAFGDDAAVAGGLVAQDPDGPVFLADAAADPLTGIAAAAAVLAALETGGAWLLDAALARTAAWVAGGRGLGSLDPPVK